MKRRAFILASAAAGVMGAGVKAEEIKNGQAFSGSRFFVGDQEYLLADIIAPPAYRLGAGVAPYFSESKFALGDLLENAIIESDNVRPPTRWGGRIVHARRRGEPKTLQEALVAAGAVRVEPQSDDLEFISQLLALEQIARTKRHGLWALPDYHVIEATNANPAIGAFHLIEGVVLGAEKVRSRFYLNFGDDYLVDFTAGARGRLHRKWAAAGLDLARLKGARLRVRGYVNDINGPSIDLTHVKQIEVLD